MHYIIYPPDPDCQKCKGTGSYFSEPVETRRTSHSSMFNSLVTCDCRRYDNVQKIMDRCDHEYVCKCSKCGKTEVKE